MHEMEGHTFTKAGLELALRPLKSNEADKVYELTQSVGWTFVIKDVLLDIHQAFPNAMWGVFDKDSTLVSTCSVFPVNEATVYFTYFITSPQYQAKGIGKYMYQEVLQHLKSPNVLLQAIPKGFPIYENWGYKLSKHYLRAFQGKLSIPTDTQEQYNNNTYIIEDMKQQLEKVVAFERDTISGVERREILQMMCNSQQLVRAKCAIVEGEIQGFVIIVKDIGGGIKTSAFQARDFTTAAALLSQVAREVTDEESLKECSVLAKFPGVNYDACARLYSMFGLKEITEEHHGMYLGKDVEAKWENVYSVLNYSVSFL